ncbi:RNA methyltransferase [Microbacterium sp. NRRL B-14842]|uniref:TrmH family RNA methyltransferase n=1 Tax=unclassified Microbacterium TaxID=2609290 RepID=UPI0021A82F49|nr:MULTISPECIES: RNA methyltransferase [unclassified Microbacterium]MCT1365265.1 RNA methyltransferase [Microbacterium sp. p3-SID131]MCT1378325.1 RNA methyltransferase [Microbacterium sp. p3-SID337]MDH5133333.1 RNA methyltransferase [Microbacterium sp. RD10]MDH5137130.1 RNA methyltransferase [Microbacterium sp. RD11]MDH5145905.1 RNA methyltransferase [Microbacterium sp. RD12]
MLENPRSPRVRAVAKLTKRSARTETGLFLLEGPQSVREALTYRPEAIIELFATPHGWERHADIRAAAAEADVEVEYVSEDVLNAMADTVTPQGLVAVVRQTPTSVRDIFDAAPRLVAICEEVRDPGNLGTIIRAADAAGADAVVLTGRTVDPYNPKVVRATTGSLFHLPVSVGGDLDEVVRRAHDAGLQILAADVKGDDLLAARADGVLGEPTAWLFGNEARGLEDEALTRADRVLRLPIFGRAESLNLATAASVCLYESAFAQRAAATG